MSIVQSSIRLVALTICPMLLIVAGCQSSGGGDGGGILKAGLPPDAQVVSEGSGQLTFVPEEAGRVFLYDVNADRVVGRYEMRRSQRLAVDAAAGRATLDGNEVAVGEIKPAGSYRIYFLGN